jgi:hypothetical protein
MALKKKRRITYLKSVDEIPAFKNEREAAEFWDTHSPIHIWDQLEEAPIEIGAELKKRLEARRPARRAQIIELDVEQMRAVDHIARRKKMDHRTLIKTWIAEGIAREQGHQVRKAG